MTALVVNHQDITLLTAVSEETGFGQAKIQLIKEWIARGATDAELALFLHTAHRVGLDPLARQIYFIKRWDSSLKRETGKPEFSIDGLRLIADRTGRYAPGREPKYEERDGALYSATAYVMKWVQGTWIECAATAHYNEFVQRTREGKITTMWQEKPQHMLAKCAEALALRRAFPAELSGLYTSDEMGEITPSRIATPELPQLPPVANGNALPPAHNLPPDWGALTDTVNEQLPPTARYTNVWHLRQTIASKLTAENAGSENYKPIDGKDLPYPRNPDAIQRIIDRALTHARGKMATPVTVTPTYEPDYAEEE